MANVKMLVSLTMVVGLRIQLNSQHTRSEAEAFWRTIRFTSQQGPVNP